MTVFDKEIEVFRQICPRNLLDLCTNKREKDTLFGIIKEQLPLSLEM